jgi:transcriptional regulator with XRE-family HTH domain
MKVHEKIRTLREEKNWSQEEMAKRLNMSVNGYSKIERGETKAYIPKLEQIADVFEVDLIELIPQNGSYIYLNNNNNGGCHIIGSPAELAFEIQKQQLQLELKDKELALQQREIENLKEIIALLKNKVQS